MLSAASKLAKFSRTELSHRAYTSPPPSYWGGPHPPRGGVGPPLPPRLLASNIACRRGGEMIFRDLNFSVHEGGAMLLTGPNGCGKSSLIRVVAGFIPTTAGWLMWEGLSLADFSIYDVYRTYLHLMGTKDGIQAERTVLENVKLWAQLEGSTDRVEESLERVGLRHYIKDKASVLSLGQRRRVQMARLLAMPRPLWLLDEPAVGLDAQGLSLLEEMIAEHRGQGGIAMVATHTPISVPGAMHLQFPPRTNYKLAAAHF